MMIWFDISPSPCVYIWTILNRSGSQCCGVTQYRHDLCIPNGIHHPPKGTSEWKQSWPPYWSVVPNRSAQNRPLQRALRNEGFRRVQLMDTSAPMILCTDSLHDDGASVWWRRRALQEIAVWSPTPFNPSKLSLRRVNPLNGLGMSPSEWNAGKEISREK